MNTWSRLSALKKKYPDYLMLFRCGDFYECYEEDAEEASRILGVSCVNKKCEGKFYKFRMAGFHHHALDTYLPKLIKAGKKVCISDTLQPTEVIEPSK